MHPKDLDGMTNSVQAVPKNRAPFHIVLVYFCLLANLNENFYTLTIKRPKYSMIGNKDCDNYR